MAFKGDLFTVSVPNSADLSAKQYMFSNYHGTLAGFHSAVLGVIQNKPLAGEHATIGLMGVTPVKAGAAIPAGKPFMVSSTGYALATNSGVAIGRAITAATSGANFTALLFGAPGVCGSVYL